MRKIQLNDLPRWWDGQGPDCDVVLGSCAELTRDFADYSFPSKCSDIERAAIESRVIEALTRSGLFEVEHYHDLNGADEDDYWICQECLTAAPLYGEPWPPGVFTRADRRYAAVVNGQDHALAFGYASGLRAGDAFNEATRIEESLAEAADFAYDEQFGYLTSWLGAVGTGLRLGVAVHLPGMIANNAIADLERECRTDGMALMPRFSFDGQIAGAVFVLTNTATLGNPEDLMVFRIEQRTRQIAETERALRARLVEECLPSTEDLVFRSLGEAREARVLIPDHALRMLSALRLGIALGLCPALGFAKIDRLYMEALPAHVRASAGLGDCDALTECMRRADMFRSEFA